MKLKEEDLVKLIEGAVENSTGMKPAELKEFQNQLKEANEKASETNRRYTGEVLRDLHGNSGEDYERRARHVISGDKFKGAGLKWARCVRAHAAAKLTGLSAKDVAHRWGDQWLAESIERAEAKSLTAGTLADGGALVSDEFVPELIELLRAMSVVRTAGPRVLDMPSGSLTMPRQTAAATASYTGEVTNITSSQQTLDQIQLTGRKLAALTPVSNDLLRQSNPSADQMVRDDLVRVMALREDLAFLRGDGTQNTPKGLLNQTAAANKFNSTGNTLANILSDLGKMMEKLEGANVPVMNPVWFMTSRSKNHLSTLTEGVGRYFFNDEILRGQLRGSPIGMSNQIPNNLGGGNNESEVYLVEPSEMIIGDVFSMELEVFPGGAFHDGANVISGISTDQTVIRALSKHDFALRHPEACAVLEAVQWGV